MAVGGGGKHTYKQRINRARHRDNPDYIYTHAVCTAPKGMVCVPGRWSWRSVFQVPGPNILYSLPFFLPFACGFSIEACEASETERLLIMDCHSWRFHNSICRSLDQRWCRHPQVSGHHQGSLAIRVRIPPTRRCVLCLIPVRACVVHTVQYIRIVNYVPYSK